MSVLPDGWSRERLLCLTSKIGSGATPRGGEKAYAKTGTPLIRSMNVHFGGLRTEGLAYIDNTQASALNGVIVKSNDVLLNITGASIGRVTTAPDKLAGARVNQHVCIVRIVEGIVPKYVAGYLATPEMQSFIREENYGVTRPALTKEMVQEIVIPVPPQAEQRRIVSKIESLSANSKRASDHLDHVSTLVEKYRNAVLGSAFRGDLTFKWRSTRSLKVELDKIESTRQDAWHVLRAKGAVRGSYQSPIQLDWTPTTNLPESWQPVSVDQVTSFVQYGSSAKTSDDDSGVPVLRMGNIQGGQIDYKNLKYLPHKHEEFPDLLLEAGDVIFNRTNSAELVGKTAVFNGHYTECSFASYLIRLRCVGILPELLSAYINSSFGRAWVATVVNQQVGQANVNGSKLKALGIPLMPQAEQHELLRRINDAFRWIDRLATESTSARKLINHFDQAVLSKAFRGELVPQDPDDEPASVLLERIKSEKCGTTQSRRGRGRPKVVTG